MEYNAKASLLLLIAAMASAQGYYLFAYFKEPARTGIYYALSNDGYHWSPLNNGDPQR